MLISNLKIGSKITAMLLLVVLLSVVALSMLSYHFSKRAVEDRYWENLKVMAALKTEQLETLFKQLESNIALIRKSKRTQGALQQIKNALPGSEEQVYDSMNTNLYEYMNSLQSIYSYYNVILLDAEGTVVFKSNQNANEIIVGKINSEYNEIKSKANETDKPVYGDPFKTAQGKLVHLNVIAPVLDDANVAVGYVVVEFDMQRVYEITNDTTGLGQTGEIVLGKLMGSSIAFLNQPRKSKFALLTQKVMLDYEETKGLQEAVKGLSGTGIVNDYTGVETVAAWTHLNSVDWGMVVKIDKSEIDSDLDVLIVVFVFAGFFIIFVSFSISEIFSKFLISPLLKLKDTLNIVAKGELPERVPKETTDEIGEMAMAVYNLVKALRRTADFAYRIGEGDYGANFKPMSDNDILGNALIRMRDSIQEADKKDNEQTWIVSGVAEIGRILKEQNDFEELGDSVIAFITEKINAIQGAFYVVEEEAEEDDAESFIEMKASYAYHRKKYLKKRFRFAEGLVGQCAIEHDTILRTEIPADYVTITSGLLGDRRPSCILVVPLISDEKVYGVMEFASFEKFTPIQVHFIQEISVIIARTIFNIKINQKTVALLQESQQMGEELQHQQEVLRQNAEEMEATQEELKRTNSRLEEQILEVNRTQRRMQMLLENASEVITMYEKDGKVRYISPSVEPILGYTQDELIGVNDITNVRQGSKADFEMMFEALIENPDEKVTIQLEYQKKNGEPVWLEATGTNLLNDPAVRGIVVNSRDITERRRAEKESRMRGQMQSLSENSLDLIMRINTEGMVYYINPIIRTLTGLKTDHFLNRNINDVGLNKDIVLHWRSIAQMVAQQNGKINTEMDFPTTTGGRIMQVNAIPEFNDQKQLESILLVSHDITERKRAEIEIRDTNRKISESINYARRIQGAILPSAKNIQEIFGNSFVYYKPRDVVSGDFPWFKRNGDTVYVAAVDCTGHGVPGALMSLIGYFLLNSIVNVGEDFDSGVVLDLLNEGVTKTLRQDNEDASTKDGMDIALCKVNLKTNQVDYAGAHRPLYYLQEDGQLEQIKGDKFPVGGGVVHYKDRTNFTNNVIHIKEGESIYFFSDGLPDQFGGPEDRKFSARKIRDIIVDNRDKDMNDMHIIFAKEVDEWKGTHKQTDDILLIGIKF